MNRNAPQTGKRQDIELLRVISAFGIVWFHSGATGNDIAYSGLIIFLVLSLYLAAQSTGAPKSVFHRAKRLLVPWLVWFTFYGAINLARHRPFISFENGIVTGILTGPSTHLWYMPFIFIMLLAFDWLRVRLSPRLIGYASAALAIIVFITAYTWRPWSLQVGAPYAQFAHALNGVLTGVFLAYYFNLPKFYRSVLLLVNLALAMYLAILPMPGVGIPYLLAISLSAVVLLYGRYQPKGINFNWLSECTLGIYLIHPFCFMIIYYFHIVDGAGVPLVVFVASTISVMLLKRVAPGFSKYAV